MRVDTKIKAMLYKISYPRESFLKDDARRVRNIVGSRPFLKEEYILAYLLVYPREKRIDAENSFNFYLSQEIIVPYKEIWLSYEEYNRLRGLLKQHVKG